MSKKSPIAFKTAIVYIEGKKLHYDLTYQRDPKDRIVLLRRFFKKFDVNLFDALHVVPRSDGTFAIVDGAGRFYAAVELEGLPPTQKYPCIVHSDIVTIAGEAELFRKLQENRKPLQPRDMFKAALMEGEPEATEVMEIVAGLDMSLSDITSPTTFRIMHRHRILHTVLSLCMQAWGHHKRKAIIYEGVSTFIRRYESAEPFDKARLLKILDATSAEALQQETIKNHGVLHPSRMGVAMSMLIAQKYNYHQSKSKKLDLTLLSPFQGEKWEKAMTAMQHEDEE